MAQGTGLATLNFPLSAQAAEYISSTVVTDSTPNQNWSLKATTGALTDMGSICYGNGRYVAATINGASATYSPDGFNWTATSTGLSGQWAAIAYGNGMFVGTVSILSNQGMFSSDNGATWAAGGIMPVFGYWLSIAFGAGLFVALSWNTSSAATSSNGSTWTVQTLPASSTWASLIFAGGKFVAIADSSSTQGMTSLDGLTWTTMTLPSVQNWKSITYGNGLYVAFASDTNVYATSTDGATWTQRLLPTTMRTVKGSAYGNSTFAVVCADGSFFVSADGLTWRFLPTNTPNLTDAFAGVCFGASEFVALGLGSAWGFSSYNVRTLSTLNVLKAESKPSPGTNKTSVAVTGLSTFTATDAVEAWIMGSDSTASHNSFEHAVAPIQLRITNPITGTGFTIQATSEYRLTGDFKVRFAFTS
jgi:hypothetical protein